MRRGTMRFDPTERMRLASGSCASSASRSSSDQAKLKAVRGAARRKTSHSGCSNSRWVIRIKRLTLFISANDHEERLETSYLRAYYTLVNRTDLVRDGGR